MKNKSVFCRGLSALTIAFSLNVASVALGAAYEDDYISCSDASVVHYAVGERHVYMVTSTVSQVTLTTKQRLTLQEALVVGGGGAGAAMKGGGGGGGGVIDNTTSQLVESGAEFAVSVGKGGEAKNERKTANKGGATVLSFSGGAWTAYGGGGGGSDNVNDNSKPSQGGSIGSGGGMGAGNVSFEHSDGGDYTSDQGNCGGYSSWGSGGGGGGGRFSPGENASSGKSGNGGEGMTNSITGVEQVYGSGGGGGTGKLNSGTVTTPAKGGTNAGDGAPYVKNATGGDAPTGFGGGGGGGGYCDATSSRGGHGGSGCVILSFTVGGAVGQPSVRKEDIVIGHYEETTLPRVTVKMGSTEAGMTYAATVRISCGTGALAQAGTSYGCVREFTSVTNEQQVVCLADFYPVSGERVYVKVEVTAAGAEDVSQTQDAEIGGTLPAFVGRGGGPNVIHVRLGAMGKGDGTSWADAYTDFRAALNQLDATRNELWFCGDNTADYLATTIAPASDATIRGGFTGLENSVAERPAGSRSCITGESAYDPLTFKNAQPLTVDGFLLTKGINHGLSKTGAGDITVTNCVFDGNGTAVARISGRGLYISGSTVSTTATVSNCTFLRHYETDVGGVNGMGTLALSSLARATVTDCLVASNGLGVITSTPFTDLPGRGGHWGTALAAQNAPVTVERCAFRGNIGNSMYINGFFGGGIVTLRGNCDGSVFRNCAWIGNNSLYSKSSGAFTDPEGGALVVRMNSADQVARVENCTFAWNFYSGSNSTAGVNVRAGTVAITNTIMWGQACGTQLCSRPADLYVQSGARALVGYSRFSASEECVADAGGTLDVGPGVTYGDPLLVTSTNDLAACRTFGNKIAFTADGAAAITAFNAHLRGKCGYTDEKTGTLQPGFPRENSPAIDAGDPESDYRREPNGANGHRVNLGYYGNTPYATMSSSKGLIVVIR